VNGLNKRLCCSLLAFLNKEDFVLVKFLVKRELASLSEGFIAASEGALERLLACVNVGVLFQVLSKCELFQANHANVLLCWGVS
jgi:hypothetical protein